LFIEYPKYNYTLLGVRKCIGDTIFSYWDANNDFIESTSASPPKYPKGRKAMSRFIKNNVKYPQEALEQGIQGTVIIKFNVLQDGSLDNFTILKEIGGGCEVELIRVFKTIPKFQPATKKGIPIKTDFTYYFTWTIRN
jgi:TonB family protein